MILTFIYGLDIHFFLLYKISQLVEQKKKMFLFEIIWKIRKTRWKELIVSGVFCFFYVPPPDYFY